MKVEVSGFTGGLVRKPSEEDLKPNQLVKATNVSVTDEPGCLKTRRGRIKALARAFAGDLDIYYQNVFSTEGLIIRDGQNLWDGALRVKGDLTDAITQFSRFAGWLLMANGTETLKFKNSGMDISWNTAFTYWHESQHIDTTFMYAATMPFRETNTDSGGSYAPYSCCFEWERTQIELGTGDEGEAEFYQASLLMHFDGDLSDATGTHTPAAVAEAATQASVMKFGSGALYVDGVDDYVAVPDSPDWSFGAGRLCIDLQIWPKSISGLQPILGQYVDVDNWWTLYHNNGWLACHLYDTAGGQTYIVVAWEKLTLGAWNHVALIRGWGGDANVWAITLNGKTTKGGQTFTFALSDFASTFNIGYGYVYPDGLSYHECYIDELRVIKGYTPWTAEFTPPTAAHPIAVNDPDAHFYTSDCSIGVGALGVADVEVNRPVNLGIAAPLAACIGADSTVGGNPDGTYLYKITYVNTDSFESNPSAASNSVVVVTNKVSLTAIPMSPDSQVIARKVYRTETGGSTYKLVDTISNNWETTYTDDTADASLGATVVEVNNPPVPFSEISVHNSLIRGVEAAAKNKVWYCNQFDEWEYFETTNYEPFGSSDDEVQRILTLGKFMTVVKEEGIWNLNTREDPEEKDDSFSNRGAANSKCAVAMGEGDVVADVEGIFFFDTVRAIPITDVVGHLFDQYGSDSDRLNVDYRGNMRLAFLGNHILLSYTRSGQVTNDRTLHFHKGAKRFESLWDVGFQSFAWDKKTNNLYGAGLDGYVYKLMNGDDDAGTGIAWEAETKDFSKEFGRQTDLKIAGYCNMDLNPNGNDYVVKVYLDGSLALTKTITGASRKVKHFKLPDETFYRIAFNFSGTAQQYLYSFAFNADPYEGHTREV